MKKSELERYKAVQKIAKDTMKYLESYIKKGVSEADVVDAANRFMLVRGVSSFWYHGVGALLFVGDRTLLSISGREYKPSSKKVGKNDFVTVDLGPQVNSCWGDYARSFVVSDGKVISNIGGNPLKKIKKLFEGIKIENILHKKLKNIAKPNMTFGELFSIVNETIVQQGYVNLDFNKNFGHSIEKNLDSRIYIEEGCEKRLSDVKLFTFEPHIKREGGSFGFKIEDIYYFSGRVLRKL